MRKRARSGIKTSIIDLLHEKHSQHFASYPCFTGFNLVLAVNPLYPASFLLQPFECAPAQRGPPIAINTRLNSSSIFLLDPRKSTDNTKTLTKETAANLLENETLKLLRATALLVFSLQAKLPLLRSVLSHNTTNFFTF